MLPFPIPKRLRLFSRYSAAALLFAPILAAQTPVSFVTAPNIGTCSSLTTGDFNGDGNLDVVCGDYVTSIWFGDGKGNFAKSTQQLVYYAPKIVAGDFNGDGHLDLVIATTNQFNTASQLVLLPGNGRGVFGPQITIADIGVNTLAIIRPGGHGPLGLAVGVTTYPGVPYQVQVFAGNGDGTFQPPVVTALAATNNIAVADCNGDGIPDLIAIGEPLNVIEIQVALGNADGSFGAPILTPVPEAKSFVVAAFTHSGFADLAWSDATSINVYRGNGDGTFSPGPVTAIPSGQLLLATDLNGDGFPDIVLSGMGIALNLGTGAFGAPQWYQNQFGIAAVAGDFRHLHRADLIVNGDFFASTGTGRFQDPRSYEVGCSYCMGLVTGDFNHDGHLDAAFAFGDVVTVLEGTGTGAFGSETHTTLSLPHGAQSAGAAVGDFNGDGILDLAVATTQSTSGQVLILPGDGTGAFGAQTVAYSGLGLDALAVADLNRDGRSDVILTLGFGLPPTVIVLCANGAGGFTQTAEFPTAANGASILIADFNHDGIPDFAYGVDVYLGNGDGTFRLSFTFPYSYMASQVGDFNGDGAPDLIVYYEEGISFWPGLGNGTFGVPLFIPTTLDVQPLAVADLNGDGIPDLVMGNSSESVLQLYLGKGDGTFVVQTGPSLPFSPGIVAGHFASSLPALLFANDSGQLTLLNNATK